MDAVKKLREMGFDIRLISGDRKSAVDDVAIRLGIEQVASEMKPEQKVNYLANLSRDGAKVLMIGDGLNDTGALAAAHASIAPASALNASRTAANFNGLIMAITSFMVVPPSLPCVPRSCNPVHRGRTNPNLR